MTKYEITSAKLFFEKKGPKNLKFAAIVTDINKAKKTIREKHNCLFVSLIYKTIE